MDADNEARAHVEGLPCYMYGIRVPENDDLPVAEQQARDTPDDILRIANECCTPHDVARAILAERRRCVESVHRTARDFYGNTDQMYAAALIASAIESGQ